MPMQPYGSMTPPKKKPMPGRKMMADGGGDLQEHRRAEVRHPFADVGGGRAAGGGDHRDNGGPDGEPDVHFQQERESGDDDDSAAQAQQGTQKSGQDREGEDDRDYPSG